jgi:hypothetical protein
MTKETKIRTPNSRYQIDGKPITYYSALERCFDDWAKECGFEPQSLRQASEQAIRTRHHEATIEHESHKARGIQPDIFSLPLGSANVYYTVEPQAIVIRGYGYEIDREPLDDFDGGGFYLDNAWEVYELKHS